MRYNRAVERFDDLPTRPTVGEITALMVGFFDAVAGIDTGAERYKVRADLGAPDEDPLDRYRGGPNYDRGQALVKLIRANPEYVDADEFGYHLLGLEQGFFDAFGNAIGKTAELMTFNNVDLDGNTPIDTTAADNGAQVDPLLNAGIDAGLAVLGGLAKAALTS